MASLYTTEVPTSLDEADSTTGSLGTALYSDVAGTITAIRYYKGSTRFDGVAIPVGLYSATGTLLASGSRTQVVGDAVGWVSVPLTTPYHTAALTTFVAAYRYGGTRGYVATAHGYATDRVNGVLHAETNAETGPPALHNGLYVQPSAADVAFPTQMFQNTDYFVDVEFTPDSAGTPATGTASATVTATGAGRAPVTATATATATAAGNARVTASGAAAATVTASGTAAGQQAAAGTAQAAVTAAGSAGGSTVGTATATATATGSAGARAAGTAAISVTAAGTAHGGGVIKAMIVGPVTGPALARTVTGPAVSPARTVVGPGLARTVTGPAVSRTITGPGV